MFTWENLDNAKIAYDKLIARIAALNPENGSVDEASMSVLKEKFQKALDADLNTSLAITTLYDVLKADMNDATKLALLDNFDQVLGLALLSHAEAKRKEAAKTTSASTASGYQITGEGDPEIDALVLKRYEAKKAKNFAEADKIRDDLKAQALKLPMYAAEQSGNESENLFVTIHYRQRELSQGSSLFLCRSLPKGSQTAVTS